MARAPGADGLAAGRVQRHAHRILVGRGEKDRPGVRGEPLARATPARAAEVVAERRAQLDRALGVAAAQEVTAERAPGSRRQARAGKALTSGLLCPGNHDERAAFCRQPPPAGPVDQVHRGNGFTLALCDSSIPGKDQGELDDETIAWLDGVLADPAPTVR